MAIDNDELLQKFVRTSMIMRHIDGDSPRCHGRGHGHGHGGCCHGHGPDAESKREAKNRRGQLRVISMVNMQEGINQKDLAYLLGIRPQTLGEMLQKLEGYGIVERKKSETDGRAIEVYLTDAGREHAEWIDEQRKIVAADIFAVLAEEEKEQLSEILDKLSTELDKHRPQRHEADGNDNE